MMPENALLYTSICFTAVSLFSSALTIYDKHAAKCGSRRVKERTLLLVSIFGGSAAMLVTMWLIRHKTRRAKFMAGIPAIIILQIAAAIFVLRLEGGVL